MVCPSTLLVKKLNIRENSDFWKGYVVKTLIKLKIQSGGGYSLSNTIFWFLLLAWVQWAKDLWVRFRYKTYSTVGPRGTLSRVIVHTLIVQLLKETRFAFRPGLDLCQTEGPCSNGQRVRAGSRHVDKIRRHCTQVLLPVLNEKRPFKRQIHFSSSVFQPN